ncbi:SUKH-3 domain-containing protein [Oerskovia merdavium]
MPLCRRRGTASVPQCRGSGSPVVWPLALQPMSEDSGDGHLSLVRFDALSETTCRALAASGWSPGRAVDVDRWVGPLEGEGYRVHPIAEEVLRRLGGCRSNPSTGLGRTS